jgi:hypothetical protein
MAASARHAGEAILSGPAGWLDMVYTPAEITEWAGVPNAFVTTSLVPTRPRGTTHRRPAREGVRPQRDRRADPAWGKELGVHERERFGNFTLRRFTGSRFVCYCCQLACIVAM